MTLPTGNLLSSVQGNYTSTAGLNTLFIDRAPTTSDVNFPVTKRWVNTVTGDEFILKDFEVTSGQVLATWLNLSNPSGTAIDAVVVDTVTAPGVNPVDPLVNGDIIFTGAQLAPATTANAIQTYSDALNTVTIGIQRSSAAAASNVALNGVSHFDSSQFSVNANGFVSLAGGGQAIDSLIPDSGTSPVVPTLAGAVSVIGSGSTTTVGGTNSLTVQLTGLTNHNVLVGAGTTTITKVAPSATSGVPFISQGAAADPVFGTAVVAGGGTGATTLTLDGVLYGNGTSPVGITAAGITGQVLAGNTGTAPTFQTLSGIAVTSITATAPLTANGLSASAQTGAVTVALTTPLALTYGGTNASLVASEGGIFYSTATAGAILPGTMTARQMLQSGSVAAPAWSTTTWPATSTINRLLYSSAANVIGEVTAANSAALVSTSAGVPIWTSTAVTGQVLAGVTGGTPSFQALSGIAVTSITGTANQIIASASTGAVTLSFANGIAIGSYQAGPPNPPAGGIMSPGQNFIGQTTALVGATNAMLQVSVAGTGPQIAATFNNTDAVATTSEARVVFAQGGSWYQGITGCFNNSVPFLGFASNSSGSPNTWQGVASMWGNGGMSISTTYYTTVPPANGAIMSGKLGVGTSSPTSASKADIAGVLAVTTNPSDPNDATAGYFWNQSGVGPTISGVSFSVRTGGTGAQANRLFATTGGEVCINATASTSGSATTKLLVIGDATFSPIAENGQFYIGGSSTTGKKLLIGFDTTSDFAWLQANQAGVGNKILCLNPSGANVGVNTSTPGSPFSVSGGISAGTFSASAAPSNGMVISGKFSQGTTNYQAVIQSVNNGIYNGDETSVAGFSTFSSSTFAGSVELSLGADATNAVSYLQSYIYGSSTAPIVLNGRGGAVYAGGITTATAWLSATSTGLFSTVVTGVTVTGAAVLIDATTSKFGTVVSSRRYKENIQSLDRSIMDLRPVKFNYIGRDEECYGLIAEEVEEVIPELVIHKDGRPETVKYHEMPAILLAEIQRLNARIEKMEKAI